MCRLLKDFLSVNIFTRNKALVSPTTGEEVDKNMTSERDKDKYEMYLEHVDKIESSNSTEEGAGATATADDDNVLGLELHDKIVRNDVEGCLKLIEKGVNVNIAFRFRQKVGCGSIERRLLSRDIEALPLHVACIYRRPKIVELLLKHEADPNLKDHLNRVPMQLIIFYWPRIMFKEDLQNLPPEEVQYQHYLQQQHAKAKAAMEYLCAHGASVSIVLASSDKKETCAHLAAKYNVSPCIETLSKYGADFEMRDTNGRTPLILAAENGNFDTLRRLVDHGANVNTQDDEGHSALHLLCASEKADAASIIKFLINHKAAPNIRDQTATTPIHVAAKQGRESAIHILLKAGACPDFKNAHGQTPIFMILNSQENRHALYGLELLLQSTVHVNIIDKEDKLPILLMGTFEHMKPSLIEASNTPPTLQRVCRIAIRRAIGLGNINTNTVAKLPCAPGLRNIILYNTVDWSH